MTDPKAIWLPNLVGGVSIWKRAVDLNGPDFFDGRLLVPETDGSEGLPVTVRWDLEGLVPLARARAADPDGAAGAVADFQACLERTAEAFATPNSGYDQYKDAFTVPSLEADDGASYHYSREQKKLFVLNWGASPRTMGGRAENVFGWQDWQKVFEGGAVAPGEAGLDARPGGEPQKPRDGGGKKRLAETRRPWWLGPLFGLVAIAAVLLAVLVLRGREDGAAQGALDAGGDGAADGAALSDAEADATSALDAASGIADAGADEDFDAGPEAGPEAGAEAGADAGADAGGDAGPDGGLAIEDDDDLPGVGGDGGGGRTVEVEVGPQGGDKTGPHRRHFHAAAVRWRITAGEERVSRTEQRGQRFDVWLGPGRTFDGVRVEWQDETGTWHLH